MDRRGGFGFSVSRQRRRVFSDETSSKKESHLRPDQHTARRNVAGCREQARAGNARARSREFACFLGETVAKTSEITASPGELARDRGLLRCVLAPKSRVRRENAARTPRERSENASSRERARTQRNRGFLGENAAISQRDRAISPAAFARSKRANVRETREQRTARTYGLQTFVRARRHLPSPGHPGARRVSPGGRR